MKVIKRIGLLAFTAFIIVIMTGCQKSNSIIGKWAYFDGTNVKKDVYYEFKKDNTGVYNFLGPTTNFTYEDKGTKLSIKYEGNNNSTEVEYSISDGILKIKDSFGADVMYKRQ